jgi:phenylacetate-CoA ligase
LEVEYVLAKACASLQIWVAFDGRGCFIASTLADGIMALNFSASLGLPPPHIKAFLLHAARHSPYYRDQDWAKNLLAGLPIRLQDIPVTPKSIVQQNPNAFRSEFDPPQAGSAQLKHTSGSTGTSLTIAKSALHFEINNRENERLMAPWNPQQYPVAAHYRLVDDKHPIGTVDHFVSPKGIQQSNLYGASTHQIGTLLREKRVPYFTGSPNMALSILQDGNDYNFLRLVKTLMEAVPDQLRQAIKNLPDCRHVDLYGSVETALIGCTCPKCGFYHLAHANSLVEILNDNDEPAEEGALGRVVVTVFSNPATPLIRYDLGDIVRHSTKSLCAPGQVSLVQIYGREKMLFHLPGGGSSLPLLDSANIEALGVKRFKMVQTALDTIEFRYQMVEPQASLDVAGLEAVIARDMSPQFKVNPVAVTEFPLAPSGKYIMHERLIP